MAIEDILKTEFVWWKELTDDEKKVIQDPREYPIFSVIYGIPENDRKEIYKSMRVKDDFQSVYQHMQEGWISFFENCFCKNHCVDIAELKSDCSDIQKIQEINKLKNEEMHELLRLALPEKFRLYFAAKFRDEMDLISPNDKRAAFFIQVDYHLGKI